MNDGMRLMGIDHGHKRIGVALSDPLGIIARPLTVLDATPKREATRQLAGLVEEHGVTKAVVGLPTDSEGQIGPQAEKVLRWARDVAGSLSVPIVLWDESYSTQDASQYIRRGRRRQQLDALSAAVILQSYLEARRTTDEPGQPIQTFFDLGEI